ncbi:hypothetical protein U14_01923 [Candidatus Moduliflexus flocculans]|uniref:Uncharacterized protein n=1 Tax=Candidatus Moduliflexus flocculans TaxID=1499966 RepID=A0A0S6VTD5_9BACT|nr:hypothetical protein U14_01923 [Candidatus Moduliflexus flocculans]
MTKFLLTSSWIKCHAIMKPYKIIGKNLAYLPLFLWLLSLSPIHALCSSSTFREPKFERHQTEIAQRIIALIIVGAKGYGASRAEISRLIQQYALRSYFSEDEWLFLETVEFEPKWATGLPCYEYKWRMEAACALLWATGYIDNSAMDNPNSAYDNKAILAMLTDENDFIRGMNIRPFSVILSMTRKYEQYELYTRSIRIDLSSRALTKGEEDAIYDDECVGHVQQQEDNDLFLVYPELKFNAKEIEKNFRSLHIAVVSWRYWALEWLWNKKEW